MKEYRKARLQELLDRSYGGERMALCRAAGITKGRLSQLLDPKEPFGDVAAHNLIDKLSLANGYFDAKHYTLKAEGGVYEIQISKMGRALARTFDNFKFPEEEHLEAMTIATQALIDYSNRRLLASSSRPAQAGAEATPSDKSQSPAGDKLNH